MATNCLNFFNSNCSRIARESRRRSYTLRALQELAVEATKLQRVRPPTALRLVGSHLRGDRFLRGGRKFKTTNADGPLGDRTLPPPHDSTILNIMSAHGQKN